MARTRTISSEPERPVHPAAWLLLASCLAVWGCQGSVYRAAKLPPEFAAAPSESPRKIDLSRLAGSSTWSDMIYPGDVIDVTIATGLEETTPVTWPLRVSDDGQVKIPLVGPVRVAGLLLTEAEQVIRDESVARQVYRAPNVAVLLKKRKTIRVTVVGAVHAPGAKELPAASADLLTALLAAGGLTDQASTIVEIRKVSDPSARPPRPPQASTGAAATGSVRIDLVEASEGLCPEYEIVDGSVIMVREREPKTIQVIGLVNKPDQFEMSPDREVRLLDALAEAGGRTMQIADEVHIIRQLDGMGEPIVIKASVRDAKRGGESNLLLAPGDIVSVEETPLTFTVGTIQSFVRFGFSAAVPGL